MKLLFALLIFVLSSCFTQRSIVGKNEPISEEVLMGLRTGKTYHFHFTNKYIFKVRIDNINDSSIVGTTKSVYHEKVWRGEDSSKDRVMDEMKKKPFVYPYNQIIDETKKVTTRKFNPYLTALPVGLIVFTAVAISSDGFDLGGWPD